MLVKAEDKNMALMAENASYTSLVIMLRETRIR